MADKKDKIDKKDKKSEAKKAKVDTGKLSIKVRLFLVVLILLGVIFLPTSMLLLVGMLPSFVAFLMGSRGIGPKASTVAAMNFAGCMPFILKLWSSGNDFEASVDILTGQQAIMVMYTAAAFGYMIDWVVTGLVSSYLVQQARGRMVSIKRRQKLLITQWGDDVSGGLGEDE